jgi:hypothetical protein
MRYKKYALFIIFFSGILLFAGCDMFSFRLFQAEEKENDSVVTLAPDSDADPTPAVAKDLSKEDEKQGADTAVNAEQNSTSAPIAPAEVIDLPIYSVNINSGETESILATVPKDTEITPELIVDKVVEAMADRSLDVGIKNITMKDDIVIVDFYKNKAPLSEIGAVYETAILDAIAMSIFDNLTDYNKVIYRADGEAYTSGHIELGINEPYLTR